MVSCQLNYKFAWACELLMLQETVSNSWSLRAIRRGEANCFIEAHYSHGDYWFTHKDQTSQQ